MVRVELTREQVDLLIQMVSTYKLQGELNAMLVATQVLNDARARLQAALKLEAGKDGSALKPALKKRMA